MADSTFVCTFAVPSKGGSALLTWVTPSAWRLLWSALEIDAGTIGCREVGAFPPGSYLILHFTIMARIAGIFGSSRGKIGNVVTATTAGVTIARQYQPSVANPNTQAQINVRAKMKLLSQLAAVMSPVIAIPKNGLVSARNQFIKKNYDFVSATSGIAMITLDNIQLTNGNAALPDVMIERSEELGTYVYLADDCANSVSRVVYCLFQRNEENKLRLLDSTIIETAGESGNFPATLTYASDDILVLAYGILDLNAGATGKFGSYSVASAADVARLVAVRQLSTADYQYTATRGSMLFGDETETEELDDNQARVYLTSSGGGSVTGAGVYTIGETATIEANAYSGYKFVGWMINGTSTYVSTNATYQFEVTGQTDLIAVFEAESEDTSYTVNPLISTQDDTGETAVSGGGDVVAGNSVTVTTTNDGSAVEFVGWFINDSGSAVSTSQTYTFVPTANVNIFARWRNVQGD